MIDFDSLDAYDLEEMQTCGCCRCMEALAIAGQAPRESSDLPPSEPGDSGLLDIQQTRYGEPGGWGIGERLGLPWWFPWP